MSLRSRLFVSVLFAAFVAALAVGIPLFLGADRLVEQAAERELGIMQRKLDRSIAAEVDKALSLAALVARQPAVGQAVAFDHRQRLADIFVPGFDAMKTQYGVEQFQFHTPQGISFLRVHKPEKFGDDLSSFRFTVVEANANKMPVIGLERGRAGIGVRAVHPIEYNGRHVGTVEFGLGFGQEFISRLTDSADDEAELYIFPMDEVATFAAKDTADARSAATFQGEPLLDGATLARVRDGETVPTTSVIGGQPHVGVARPIKDFAGNVSGVAHLLTSQAALQAISSEISWTAAFAALLAMGLAIVVALFVGRRIGGAISGMADRMSQLAGGDLTTEIPALEQKDEIGRMANAVLAFKQAALEKQRVEAEAVTRREEAEAERRQNGERQQMTAQEQELVVGEIGSGL
ncbi:cache domain-containing protein, partial [Aurantimonas sp. C2-3-R2]|uniref:cache domain-containing protein n=4 Tax=unclassified Aurantimonas TaxID=2638230 RepID=UPI002E1869EF|nr:cache domain-containing protein [Aurantimonas sp. C2-3-R2]